MPGVLAAYSGASRADTTLPVVPVSTASQTSTDIPKPRIRNILIIPIRNIPICSLSEFELYVYGNL